MKIGIFGSAFNPPTLGHYNAICQSLLVCDKVLLVPSFKHAFNKEMLSFDIRCKMTQSFIDDLFINKNVQLSTVEKDIGIIDEPIYTYNLLDYFSEKDSDNEYIFLCGEDNFYNFDKFKNYEYILSKWKVHCLKENSKIRSTLIRNNLINNISINNLTSKTVIKIIEENNLYKGKI